MTTELLQQAMDALETIYDAAPIDSTRYELVDSIRAHLLAPPATDERLLNLLARIHGDGGHYVDEHGLDKACVDAELCVAEMHAAPAAVPLTDQEIIEIFRRNFRGTYRGMA